MIPENEKRLCDKMEQASLDELMPEFDKQQEWLQLASQLQPAKKKVIPVWCYAAAILVLIPLAAITWYLSTGNGNQSSVKNNNDSSSEARGVVIVKDETGDIGKGRVDTSSVSIATVPVSKRNLLQDNDGKKVMAGDIIYNNTDCPIELRISQTMSCPDNQPKAISSSSTLEPDQKGKINYRDSTAIARNCSLTIKEIEIRSIATGEVILLNAHSIPSTAQEVFRYITREKTGDVLAGNFNYDCEKRHRKHSLRLENRDGNLILE